MNTYLATLYNIYFSSLTWFLFHFQETLQMTILLTRMKIYNWVISLSLFLTCLLIDYPASILIFKDDSIGTYYDESKQVTSTFYYFTASELSLNIYAQLYFALVGMFLNLFLCLVAGIALNILSVSQYRSYVSDRRKKDEAYTRVAFSRNENQAAKTVGGGDDLNEISVVVSRPKVLTQKEKRRINLKRTCLKWR